MSLNETKHLLRAFRIAPNKLLGQNFMIEPLLYSKMTKYAALTQSDVVLDAGAGFGFLTRFMAGKCKAVVAVEKDPRMAEALREQVKDLGNVLVVKGDVLKVSLPEFKKIVAIPPYYLSSSLVVWLLEHTVDCAVLILQKEFTNRLVAAVGSEDYGWLTVIANSADRIDLLDEVPRTMFYPQPKVDSLIVRIARLKTVPFKVNDKEFFVRLVRWLFTQRNKKVSNVLVSFLKTIQGLGKQEAKGWAAKAPFGDKRVRDLAPRDFGELADAFGY